MLPGNSLSNNQLMQELLHKTILNQAYLATVLKAQAQILATMDMSGYESIYHDMNEQVNQTVKSLYILMEEKYK